MDIGLKIGRGSLIATDNEFHGVYRKTSRHWHVPA